MADINVTNEIIDVNVTEEVITVAVDSGAYPLAYPVYSVFGRTGTVVATEGDYSLTQLSDVTLTSPASGQTLTYNGTTWVNSTAAVSDNLIKLVRNNSGATITAGTVVYINGALGNKPTIAKALATGDATSAQTYGLVQTSIANNADGYVVVIGDVDNLNTSSFTEGDQLYLSGTTAGTYTHIKPYAPIHLVYIGIVLRSHPTLGIIGVKIQNGYEMDELHNVAAQSPNNGDILQYVSSTNLWTKTAGSTTNISEGTNLYYTDVRARASNSFVAGSGAYNSTTGVITIPTNNNQITNGSAFITLTGLSATTPLSYNNTTGVFTISQASASANGFLASGDFNTFNNKQNALTNPVTGTGTTNTLPKFTGASAIGDSNITDTGSLITLGSNSFVNGNLGIGSSSLTLYNLRIARNITGGTSAYAIGNLGVIQSDVTSNAYYNFTTASTVAAAFTLTTLGHYRANQGTFGAGSAVTSQYGFWADNTLVGATNNYGFYGAIPAASNAWNLYMVGTANNYMAGNIGIGGVAPYISSGPILTTTLTNGGSGYVDGTYTDVATTLISSTGIGALFTIVVSGGVVTSATLTWAGVLYKVGDTITVSNTLLGGTGSGLIITINTVDSSQFYISNANGGDISLFRIDTSLAAGESLGTIKWLSNDSSVKANGLQAEIGAFGAGTAGGAYLSFFTRSATAGTSLVEAMRIGSEGNVGIGATALTQYSLRVSKNITGSVNSYGIFSDGVIQSGVTTNAYNFLSYPSTVAASFTLTNLHHFNASQNAGLGAGSAVTNQFGFTVDSSLTAATNNYGFYGNIASGTNRWNLYMNGTAANYMAGNLAIGSAAANSNLYVVKNIIGGWVGSATFGANIFSSGAIQSDVTNTAYYNVTRPSTAAAIFTLGTLASYSASTITKGAGSTITSTVGFFVESTHIGGTNNYGFYGGLASATNTWNLYMAGTAANYMAGNLFVGVTSGTAWIDVAAGTTAKAQINLGSSTAPTSPVDGDIWFDGTALKIRIGGVTKTVTVT